MARILLLGGSGFIGLQHAAEWERQNPPHQINPALFDDAAEDALIARLSFRERSHGAA